MERVGRERVSRARPEVRSRVSGSGEKCAGCEPICSAGSVVTEREPTVCVVGHPYGPLGYHRAARCSFASFQAAGMGPTLMDISDDRRSIVPNHEQAFKRYASREFAEFNLFHLN